MILNPEESTLSLTKEELEKAYKDNDESISHELDKFGLGKRSKKVNLIFNDFLEKLEDLWNKV